MLRPRRAEDRRRIYCSQGVAAWSTSRGRLRLTQVHPTRTASKVLDRNRRRPDAAPHGSRGGRWWWWRRYRSAWRRRWRRARASGGSGGGSGGGGATAAHRRVTAPTLTWTTRMRSRRSRLRGHSACNEYLARSCATACDGGASSVFTAPPDHAAATQASRRAAVVENQRYCPGWAPPVRARLKESLRQPSFGSRSHPGHAASGIAQADTSRALDAIERRRAGAPEIQCRWSRGSVV